MGLVAGRRPDGPHSKCPVSSRIRCAEVGCPQLCGALVDVAGVVVEVVVVVPAGAVPGPPVVVVEGTGVEGTEVVLAGVVVADVVVVVPVVVVVVAVVVAVVAVVDVVVAATEVETLRGPEAPNMPDELSVTSSTVVPWSAKVTFTVATPAAKLTLLPAVQSPGAG